jgi:hypothetical protein
MAGLRPRLFCAALVALLAVMAAMAAWAVTLIVITGWPG